jgi:biopolymer transport protein ExbD
MVENADHDRIHVTGQHPRRIANGFPATELHLGADKAVRYEHVAAVLAVAQKAGLKQIAFVTEPPAAKGANP